MLVKLLKYVVNRGTDVRAEWGVGGWGTDAGRDQCTAVDGRRGAAGGVRPEGDWEGGGGHSNPIGNSGWW